VNPLVSTLDRPRPKSAFFDSEAAARAVSFFALLPHVKGKWAGQPFVLEAWQRAVIEAAFGWKVSKGGPRLYREVFLEVPRKQGKSTMAAGVAGILTFADREPGAEVYCLDPATRILHADLTWRPIGEAKEGQELLAFDEFPTQHRAYRKLRRSAVESVETITQPSYRLRFTNGREVIASAGHQWLGMKWLRGELKGWYRTDELMVGSRVRDLGEPWDSHENWRRGYLAGIYDGEGSIFRSLQGDRPGFRIGFGQLPGLVLDQTRQLLEEEGFNPSVTADHHKGSSGVQTFNLSGAYNCLRFLGQVRPVRLLENAPRLWEGKGANQGMGRAVVESIEFLGDREVMAMGTSTRTLFAEGLFSHNSLAVDREQAGIVFNVLREMVEASPELAKRSESFRRSIVVPKTRASYKVLSADVPSKHGLNASGYVVDEVHAHPNRELIDVIATSTGSREQPLGFLITTAGVHDETSIGWEKHHYTEQVASGIVEDPSFLGVIYAAESTDDWTSEETWEKANPGLGVTVSREYLRRECEKAKAIPAYENTFKRLHLNLWTAQFTRWLPLDAWDASAGMVDAEKLAGETCYAGVHLASASDVASLVLLFPRGESYDVVPFFWVPEDAMKRTTGVPYLEWARQGFITVTEGPTTDYAAIRAKLDELARTYQLEEIGHHPWNAVQFMNELADAGMEVTPVRPGYGTLTAPTKELLSLILDRKLRHGGNPVLRYMADNAAVMTDADGNIKLAQDKSTGNISGISALVMALDRAIRNQESEPSIILI
jgi:phage terminase large subunit-like protein